MSQQISVRVKLKDGAIFTLSGFENWDQFHEVLALLYKGEFESRLYGYSDWLKND